SAGCVGDPGRAEGGRRVDRRQQVRETGGVGLDQDDATVSADRRDHVQIKRDLLRPASVGSWEVGASILGNLPEAAVGRRAGWETELGSVYREVTLRRWIVEGVHDRHSLAGAGAVYGQPVSVLKVVRVVSGWHRTDEGGLTCRPGQNGVTARVAGGHAVARTDSLLRGSSRRRGLGPSLAAGRR